MATWKKVLREDYAVGTSDGLLVLDSSTTNNDLAIRLWDNRNNGDVPGTNHEGLEIVTLNFDPSFAISGTDITLTPLQIQVDAQNAFELYDGTNYTLNLQSTDESVVLDGSTPGTILIDVAVTTITGTEDSETDNYQAGADDITFASYTTEAIGVVSSVSGTTVSLGVPTEAIQDVVGNMILAEDGAVANYDDDANTITITLENLALATNFGDNQYNSGEIDYTVTTPTLTINAGDNSGLSVLIDANNQFVIDLADYTISGNESDLDTAGSGADAAKSPVSNILFKSTDESVTVTASNAGVGDSDVIIDLQAQATVTLIDDVATGVTEKYSVTMTSATETGPYAAYFDAGLYWTIIDDNNTETRVLTVAGDTHIEGNLVVSGDTTTINTATVTAEDQLIVLGLPDTSYGTDGAAVTGTSGGGIVLASANDIDGTTNTNHGARVIWNSTADLTGWSVANTGTTGNASTEHEIAVMDHAGAAPTGATASAGKGAFYFDTANDVLYVAISA